MKLFLVELLPLVLVLLGFIVLLVGSLIDGKRTRKRLDWHQAAFKRKNGGLNG